MTLLTLIQIETGQRVAGETAREFGKMDPTGLAIILIAMSVVLVALILLYLTYKFITKLYNIDLRKMFGKSQPDTEVIQDQGEISGETLVAISLALHMYHQQLQGLEDAVITFKNAAKTYSPWSSKIYGLRRTPNH